MKSADTFERLKRYQITEGLTWKQVGDKLGVSVSMIMMVKNNQRQLSPKALHKLGEAEQEVVDRKRGAERVVEALLNDELSAVDLVKQATGKTTSAKVSVNYKDRRIGKSLPNPVTLFKPSEDICAKLRKLFTETLDTRVIVLTCLPKDIQTEAFLEYVTIESFTKLTNAALHLVIPNWRTLVAQGLSED